MRHKLFIKYCLLGLVLMVTVAVAAVSPVTELQGVANRMISQLDSNKARLGNISVIRRIVNSTLLPHVDLNRMSASVVGRNWRTATPAQQAQFKKEFSDLVTTTYASALASYDDDRVEFRPLRENVSGRQTTRVDSVIVRKNGQRIPISYDVAQAGGQWKVYDFSIEHVSMVQSYRSQFAGVLANGGMPALLSRLASHNRNVVRK
ncbi:MAG: hypothetical protein A3I77_00085 [Gammaproteobacteria bacterium RIFCSPLOWO2_02_FULL_42_14]|nr:MAG: hypothetical protein A3B71_00085 [Gammaproteobacteria bacterium RIFCSPHIGHO2_02_FULL_42_43]OGT28055.1 MAG: hypothetical protein A2624_03240 [Gammaproteobacteria bacterium RIFCSPHIGHO2_01_FULL_42_8]OGT51892.1 MAG: hypothetical protein A3E54_01110 [Gammaproteobacteria bacterium RIFCSPHIGHO2_12_FULL_41_25]OGT62406.1 MAG: hypothetical protein A3I77_00085 [Gammaproteobacteria bacterium RIFCSPLOWO2_02_FULL_42_14]OGT85358.1 MAG: hypothetical protein A3G86_08035 [Gammaproteobacteria bacterium R